MEKRNSLVDHIKECRSRQRTSTSTDLVTSWRDEEIWNGELRDCFTIIFRTKGCRWSSTAGCSMCGYHTDTNPDINTDDLLKQLEEAISRYDGEDIVKIYTSGSFFDSDEVPENVALKILSSFDSEKTLIESRPEFITNKTLDDYGSKTNCMEVAVGLETASDFVRNHCINKGFSYEAYKEARDKVLNGGHKLRTYLLLKPPFLSEEESVQDVLFSIKKVSRDGNITSINPTNMQRGSLVHHLWRRRLYRPPWIWSIVDVLREAESDSPLLVSKVGLGSKRGAHNCSECEGKIIDKIDEFNKTQDISSLDGVDSICDCRERYLCERRLESMWDFRGSMDILSYRDTGYI
ncbi:MAG: archaeosine biosynthesis radical SAM protein RaSEA [Thermoplasmata archaeon]